MARAITVMCVVLTLKRGSTKSQEVLLSRFALGKVVSKLIYSLDQVAGYGIKTHCSGIDCEARAAAEASI